MTAIRDARDLEAVVVVVDSAMMGTCWQFYCDERFRQRRDDRGRRGEGGTDL